MNKKLNIVVTSGGTDVPIDDVRVISNRSTGTTGALITEEGLRRGHQLHLLRSKTAKKAFGKDLQADPLADIDEECARLRATLLEVNALIAELQDETIKDFADYRERLLQIVADPTVDVAVVSMAASDFGPEKTAGKIRSDPKELSIQLTRLPKIIAEIKGVRREIFLVGFKFLAEDASPDELIETAYKSLLQNKLDLVVANKGVIGTPELLTYLITLEKGIIPVRDRSTLAKILLETIEQRYSKQHYRTKYTQVDELAVPETEMDTFLQEIRRLSYLALFPSYLMEEREEFGFVAKRTEQGTLVTGRGSSKSQATIEDLALVTHVDQEERILTVESLQKKASLNAGLAHLIFSERPEVQYIVHSHISLPDAVQAKTQSTPGTQEDWDRIKDLVSDGAKIIFQPGHGVIILLENLDELIPLLRSQNIYSKRSESYDTAYSRFQKGTKFVEIVSEELDPSGAVLDMCAGTGDVSRQLYDRGYTNLNLADASQSMLDVARQKISELDTSRFSVISFDDFAVDGEYDGIVIRQAINYTPPEKLSETFQRLRRGLKSGGKLIFNSFTADGLQSALKPVKKDQIGSTVALTQEGNIVEGNMIHHGQRTEIFNTASGDYDLVYDLNSFYTYTPQEFEQALKDAGFQNVQIQQERRSVYICAH